MIHPIVSEVHHELQRIVRTDSPSLQRIVDYFLQQRGMGIRPLLVFLCGEIVSAPKQNLLDLAAATELLHMASLVHDDIVDQTAIRRNQPSVHHRFGEGAAVLLGDYFFGKLLKVISSYPPVLAEFSETIESLVAGEFMQIDQQGNSLLSQADYLQRIYAKTARFISSCCKIGCLLVDVPPAAQSLAEYGYNLGMAYQIIDDLQDVIGDPNLIGKPVLQDLSRGIYTLPYLHSLHQTPSEPANRSTVLISPEAILYTKKTAASYISKSIDALTAFKPSETKTQLIHFALQQQQKLDNLQEESCYAPTLH
ncbi:polyprenyl synthetase family protein [Effusibacillus dendaii]|uniref:Polyprenyl synthetase n=1 Tax=Effusibacillus dendaii TaxID=2743772 RepID=A0A7I8DB99_9BACL|nr:polyprenyl synthetase family protein [Effusibacillus dendaii]BCJ87463.1 polyprenyl synthetase [Effusibacillus dendaii]